jgi:hypothetical protein
LPPTPRARAGLAVGDPESLGSFFSSVLPPSFFSFRFISFSVSFLSFSRFFFGVSFVLLTVPLQAHPSFAPVRPRPSSCLFAPRSPRSLATNGASCPTLVPTLVCSRSLCSLATKRVVSPAASGSVFSQFSRVRLWLTFVFFSQARAFPTGFALMLMHLVTKSSNDTLIQTAPNTYDVCFTCPSYGGFSSGSGCLSGSVLGRVGRRPTMLLCHLWRLLPLHPCMSVNWIPALPRPCCLRFSI